MKRSTLTVAMGGLAVGVLALGACSSAANQIEPSDSASHSREAAPNGEQSPTGQATLAAATSGPFKDVTLTHNPDAKCSRKETAKELVFRCSNVPQNLFGDGVYVRFPNDNFNIRVAVDDPKTMGMLTTLRNAVYGTEGVYQGKQKDWIIPYAQTGWGVGVDAFDRHDPISINYRITQYITK